MSGAGHPETPVPGEADHNEDTWRARLRARMDASGYLEKAYLLFVGAFFFLPSSKWHGILFNASLLLPYLLTVSRASHRIRLSSPVYVLSVLGVVYFALTVLWSDEPASADLSKFAFQALTLIAFLSIGIDLSLSRPGFMRRLTLWLSVCTSVSASLCLLAFFDILPYLHDDALFEHRANGMGRLTHPILAATTYTAVAMLALLYRPLGKDEKPIPPALRAFTLLVSTAFLLLSHSRGPWVALVLTAPIIGLVYRKLWLGLMPAAALLLGLALAAADLAGLGDLLSRSQTIWYRLEGWQTTLEWIAARPWFGHGIASDDNILLSMGVVLRHPHNVALASALYGGAVGLAAFVSLEIALIAAAWRLFRQGLGAALLAVTCFTAFCMMFDGYKLLTSPKAVWLYFWLPCALICALQIKNPGLADPDQTPG